MNYSNEEVSEAHCSGFSVCAINLRRGNEETWRDELIRESVKAYGFGIRLH